MVEVTDWRVSDEDKQVVVLLGGTHGSEEAGRLVSMAVMEWLASGEPYMSLRNQKFVIFPCVNPDGSIADSYHNAQDINIYTSYGEGGEPTSHEGRIIFESKYGWILLDVKTGNDSCPSIFVMGKVKKEKQP